VKGSRFETGTEFNADSYNIPLLSAHWIHTGVKHGGKRLQRDGIDA
jgi:hypothetical protein